MLSIKMVDKNNLKSKPGGLMWRRFEWWGNFLEAISVNLREGEQWELHRAIPPRVVP